MRVRRFCFLGSQATVFFSRPLLRFWVLPFVLSVLATGTVRAQFNLTGDYIQLPIASNGRFLTDQGAKFNKLGTGGGSGIDFWVWGSPVYNYTIEANGNRRTNGASWFSGPTVQNTSNGTTLSARIFGNPFNGLYFERNVQFDKTDRIITISDAFRNTGTTSFVNLSTLDNTDPDQGVPIGWGYSTYNDVIDAASIKDLMFAAVNDTGNQRGLTIAFGWRAETNSFSVLGVNPSGLDNTSPYSVIRNAFDPNGAFADVGINLASDFGSLSPGGTKSAVWYIVFGATTADAVNLFTNVADTVPPDTVITAGPESGKTVCSLPVHFEWTGVDNRTPPNRLEFQWRVDGGAWSDWSPVTAADVDGLVDGTHLFEVRARDIADNVDGSPAQRAFTLTLNTQAPAISNVRVTLNSLTSVSMAWNTDQPATSQVEYGPTTAYGTLTPLNTNLVTSHSVTITGLQSNIVYHFRVRSKNECGRETTGGDGTFGTSAPDLQVSALSGPNGTLTDRSFDVGWTDANTGRERANAPWTDRVYLSADAQPGGDRLLGAFPLSQSLNPGQSAARTQIVSIPRDAVPANGTYYLIVVTDADGAVLEGNETNNFRAIPIVVTREPLPDLTVPAIAAPGSAFFGQTITVQWTVKNVGAASTDASEWHDRVFLSTDQTPDSGDAWQADVLNVSYLDAGESYVAQATLRVPLGLTGSYFILVKTDNNDGVREDIETNNVGSRPIQLLLAPVPDLQVASVLGPEEAFAGDPMLVTWRVENRGTGPVPPDQTSWTDAVYLSADENFDPSADRLVGTFPHTGALATGAGYTVQSQSVPVPRNIAGDYYVFVLTDRGDQVYEYLFENNNFNYDRRRKVHINATPPDLVVSAFTVPGSAVGGQPISITWTVTNQGAFEAPASWSDAVYVSSSPTLNRSTATLLGTYGHGVSLPAGLSYTQTASVVLPPCGSGQQYLFVVTDSSDAVFEYDPNFDAEANNTSAGKAVQSEARPPDLQVSNVVSSASGTAGQPLSVSWNVTNAGTGPTLASSWTDRVYLSRSATFDGTAVVVGSFTHNGALAAGAGYSRTEGVTVPPQLDGALFVFVQTDAGNSVNECSAEGNNVGRGTGSGGGGGPVIGAERPDLQIAQVNAPGAARADQTISLSWSGVNRGTAVVSIPAWNDVVYFSQDATLDAGDQRLQSTLIHGPLAINATYPASAQVRIPNVPAGTYYLIIQADGDDYVFEGSLENNNTRASAITITKPNVDLQITAAAAAPSAFAGQETTVNWTVTNAGSEAATAPSWTDQIILSRDQILDTTDSTIGYSVHTGELAGGANYQQSLDVTIPRGLSGTYYLFIRTDAGNRQPETDENNNVVIIGGGDGSGGTPIQILLPAPSDLTVTATGGPANTLLPPGQNPLLTWTVKNQGQNPATGTWQDAVYLSADTTWDIGDALVGRVPHAGPLSPGASYTGSLSEPLPSVLPGSYHVIVRTDIRNNVRETNEANNNTASTGTMTVDVVALTLGSPQSADIGTGENHYFKVFVPAGETLLVRLDGPEGSAMALYLRRSAMVSQSAFDFQHDRPNESDQEIIVPTTREGWYYVLVHGDSLPGGAGAYTIQAEIVPFSIRSVSSRRAGNTGQVTVRIEGARFDRFTRVQLSRGGLTLEPIWTEITDTSRIHATFDLTGVAAGTYDLRAVSEQIIADVNTAGTIVPRTVVHGNFVLPDALEVVAEGGPLLKTQLLLPASARFNNRYSFFLEVANAGTTDLPVPVLLVASPNGAPVSVRPNVGAGTGYQEQILVLGERRRTVLAPGERILVPLYGLALREPSSRFLVENLSAPGRPLVWDALEAYYRDQSDPAQWGRTWTNFKQLVGGTWDSLHTVMRKDADDRSFGTEDRFYTGSQLINDLIARARNGQTDPNAFQSGSASRQFGFGFGSAGGASSLSFLAAASKAGAVAPLDLADFCQPVSDPIRLAAIELSFRLGAAGTIPDPVFGFVPVPIGLPQLYTKFGIEVGDLWNLYVSNTPAAGRVVRNFTDGDDIVEGSRLSDGFRKSVVTKRHLKHLMEKVKESLKQKCPDFDGSKTFQLTELIPDELKPDQLNDNDASNPNSLNYNNPYDIPGNIAGGIGTAATGQVPPDQRRVQGTVTVTKHKDKCGKFQYLEIKAEVKYIVDDTIDFCPGDPGGTLEQVLTIPLSQLEASGKAFDVGIHVEFTAKPDPITLDAGEIAGGACVEDPCKKQPPGPDCAPPCPNDCEGSNTPPNPPDCDPDDEDETRTVRPRDPNDKIGPAGFGPQGFTAAQQTMPYTIHFENVATASAAAQRVRIIDPLDSDLDWRTFRLKEIGFNNYRVVVPENRSFYQTRIPLGPELGNILADISASVDIRTGEVRWTLTAMDPNTGEQPENPLLGLLPPNDATHRGEGYVTFTVQPRSGLPTGTEIANQAQITFDVEEPILTNIVLNTLDLDVPASQVVPLPAQIASATFTLTWAGSDPAGGAGLRDFDIYVSDNNGAYTPWLTGVTQTSASYTGQPGHTYRFYSIARDNAGNVEAAPDAPDAVTRTGAVPMNPVPVLSSLAPTSAQAGGAVFVLTVNGANFINGSVVRWNGQPRATTFVSGTQLTAAIPAADLGAAGAANVTVVTPGPGGGTSNTLIFSITPPTGSPTLQVLGAAARREGGNLVVEVTIVNNGDGNATGVRLLSTTRLNGVAMIGTPPEPVPLTAGGGSAILSLTFPGTAAGVGSRVTLNVNGTSDQGPFTGSRRVDVP